MSNTNKNGKWYETVVGKKVTEDKYFHDGEVCFTQLVNRVSGIFSTPKLKGEMFLALHDADFFPAGRSLYGAGSKGKFKASMSNCYILPMPTDDTHSINMNIDMMESIFKRGGGCGVNISNLRPRGAKVQNSATSSTGAVSFMNKYSVSAETIGANNRRAALMIGLNCDHPDIEEFLEIKKNNDKVQGANISILFTDEFMHAVEKNEQFTLRFEVEATGEKIKKEINARDFFIKFAESQWDWAEPGAIFIDTMRKNHLLSGYPPHIYSINITNPCAEYQGNAFNSCNLGSINLYNIVDAPFTPKAGVNLNKLEELVTLGVRALDEILDYGYDMQPLDENRICIDHWRAIGLGVFGMADMFIAMGVKYGNNQANNYVETIMKFILHTALKTSNKLAEEKGAFNKYNWEYIKKSPLIAVLEKEDPDLYNSIKAHGLRNGSLLSIAPTGSIATMCNCSGGVEPLFAVSYQRTTHALQAEGKYFKVLPKSIEDLLIFNGIDPQSISDEEIVAEFPHIIVSHEIDPKDRIKMQSTMQKYVDNAISSTINLKKEATVNDIFDAYLYAWKSGCKGITTFRNGCARNAIMLTNAEVDAMKKAHVYASGEVVLDSIIPMKRKNTSESEDLDGKTAVKHTACVKNMYVTRTQYDGNLFEVFTNFRGGCQSNIDTITSVISLYLRGGGKVEELLKEMKGNTCKACTELIKQGKKDISPSCGIAIAEAIETYYKDLKGAGDLKLDDGYMKCPECRQKTLIPTGKCVSCTNPECNYTRCD